MLSRYLSILLASTLLAACGDDGGSAAADASEGDTADADPNAPDAMGVADAMPTVDAGPCAEDLAPLADDSLANETDPNVVIAEIDPGTGGFIEVYNSGDSAVDLSATGYYWCNNRAYPSFQSHSVTVEAGGRAALDWPGGGGQESGGDVAIYVDNSAFQNGANILDYVCWGTPSDGGSTRMTAATDVDKWTGACASAIPAGGSLARKTDTQGTAAADYETLATPTPETCK